MSVIRVEGNDLDVDIAEELGEFVWTKPTWRDRKLIAASPFRYDNTPSFFVNLETGGWKDSGAYDAEFESGNLPKLLAFLRDETYEETVEYLTEVYGVREDIGEKVSIPPIKLHRSKGKVTLDNGILQKYAFRHPYLSRRHISEKVQRFMGAGFSRQDNAVTMPWRHPNGTLANIKFRKVKGKTFWYAKGAAPVRSLVYGIDKVYRHDLREVVLCEAEIDAMSWYTCGVPAIALGGTTVTKTQLDLIRKSPIETIILAMDNDKAGGKMGRAFTEGMRGFIEVVAVEIPADYKDANETLVAGVDLEEIKTNRQNVTNVI